MDIREEQMTYHNARILADVLGGNTTAAILEIAKGHAIVFDACGNITSVDGRRVLEGTVNSLAPTTLAQMCGKHCSRFLCTLAKGHKGPHGRAYRRRR